MAGRRAAVTRAVLAVVLAAAMTGTAWAGAPTEDLKRQTDRVLEVLRATNLTPAARRAAVRELATDSFDLGETARRALGTHWQGRTPAERDEFVRVFRDVLERTYVARIDEYGGERLEYVAERVDGDSAIVKAQIVTKSGMAVPVESRLNQRGGRWLVYDVNIEGVSLVSNYRTQFNKIIQTSSFNELIQKLKTKQGELTVGEQPKDTKPAPAKR